MEVEYFRYLTQPTSQGPTQLLAEIALTLDFYEELSTQQYVWAFDKTIIHRASEEDFQCLGTINKCYIQE